MAVALTELMLKQLKAEEKTYSISDGRGLMIEVRTNGSKLWVIRYWVSGKERRKSVGTFPGVSLKEARDKNYLFRKSLEEGNPIGFDAETFSTVAEEWIKKRMAPKVVEKTLRTVRLQLDHFILPFIGHMKLAAVTPGTVLQICRRIEDKGTLALASRVKQVVGQIFNYAIATDRAETNPTLALRGALQARKEKHLAALTEPEQIGALMRHIAAYRYDIVRYALTFSALVFCRPGEVRAAEWKEISWERAQWEIPKERMKMRRPHIVPLARQTIELLKELQMFTGKGRWLFPSARNDGRCMSENTIRVALRSMGYTNEDMTAHGFRGMATTILYNNGFTKDHVERQLAHAEKNAVIAAYNHAEYLPQRRDMMQWWADWLDVQKNRGEP
jgi:integrase